MRTDDQYTTGEILQQIPGITRETIYSWCDRGYITPNQSSIGDSGSYRRKRFRPQDVLKIQLIWKYHRQGFPPRLANQRAEAFLVQRHALTIDLGDTPSLVQLARNQVFDVSVKVEAYQFESCQIAVSFDEEFIALQSGKTVDLLAFEAYDADLFYDEAVCRWQFRAIRAGNENRAALIHVAVTGTSIDGVVVERTTSVAVEVRE